MIRSRQAARATALDDVAPTMQDTSAEDPERAQGSSEIRERVRAALGKVSPKAAEIFVLRYFEGYDNHEIASMLGASRSTVNVILHRTREKLKEDVQEFVGDRS